MVSVNASSVLDCGFKPQRYYINSAMDNVNTSSVLDCGFKPLSGQTKEYLIAVVNFTTKDAALSSKSKV